MESILSLLLASAGLAAEASPPALKWIRIPAGTFDMSVGALVNSPHAVVTVRAFELMKAPVTNAQYHACVEAEACTAPAHDYGERFDGPEQPVVGVTWEQANAFALWEGARLPSESEWEYAALNLGRGRAAPATCETAVLYDVKRGNGCGRNATWPVCSKPPDTEQGFCDMAGNVVQWLEDTFLWEDGRHAPPPPDGSPRETPSHSRLMRGTAWDDRPYFGTIHFDNAPPNEEFDYVGFRLARSAAGP